MDTDAPKRPRGRPRLDESDPLRTRRYAGRASFSIAEIREALVKCHGSSAHAAAALNEAEELKGGPRRITGRALYLLAQRRGWLKSIAEYTTNILNEIAKSNISQAIEAGDIDLSKWWLERRSEEFKSKGKIDLMSINPRDLADAVLLKLFDPFALDERQLAMLVERIGARLTAARQMKVIEHEPTGGTS